MAGLSTSTVMRSSSSATSRTSCSFCRQRSPATSSCEKTTSLTGPRQRDDVFLPVFQPWEGGELATAIEMGYRNLVPSWDEGTEDKIFRVLFDVFRHKKGAGAELSAIKPTVAEMLAKPASLTYHLLAWDPDYPGYGWDDIVEYAHRVPEVEALMRQTMILHNEYRW